MTIKELREYSEMTQKEFSKYLNIPYRSIQNWEESKRKCPEYIIELIEYKLKKEKLI